MNAIFEDVRSIKIKVSDLAGMPGDFCEAHAVDEDGFVTITTDYPDYRPFMIYAENTEARKELFLCFHSRAYPKNEDVLKKMIARRQELARLLGYDSWADYVMEDKMIKTSSAVQNFIDAIDAQARIPAQRDYDALLAEKRLMYPDATEVEEFEKSFWEERAKRRNFNFDSLAVRAYFEYNKVQDGLLALTEELFGISYQRVDDAVVWHSSVDVFDVFRAEKNIGRIYLDMHPRVYKYKHAAQFTLQSGVAGIQLPEGVLVCNFSDPSTSSPALMDHDQVTTFFHEFGHLLHHILGGAQEFIYFSGVATERDFVEAPSKFFEEWEMDAATLKRFAHHTETHEQIPTGLVECMRAADEFGKGLFVRRQMVFAALSLHCYNRRATDPEISVHDLGVLDQTQYGQFPHTEGTYHECSFGHLDGYSAIYYTYMWSLVIAKDLLSKFPDHDMMNEVETRAYARSILEPGGSKDAADLVKDFLGREYSFDAFNTWLAT
ncbi:MAG: Zn-dependent oligopeptidase [Candidatus Magasanikbacteria bacterium]|nr:Zn-dependent oligopeptidase [Candidatus Magasanikbacteria bacterium]